MASVLTLDMVPDLRLRIVRWMTGAQCLLIPPYAPYMREDIKEHVDKLISEAEEKGEEVKRPPRSLHTRIAEAKAAMQAAEQKRRDAELSLDARKAELTGEEAHSEEKPKQPKKKVGFFSFDTERFSGDLPLAEAANFAYHQATTPFQRLVNSLCPKLYFLPADGHVLNEAATERLLGLDLEDIRGKEGIRLERSKQRMREKDEAREGKKD